MKICQHADSDIYRQGGEDRISLYHDFASVGLTHRRSFVGSRLSLLEPGISLTTIDAVPGAWLLERQAQGAETDASTAVKMLGHADDYQIEECRRYHDASLVVP